MITFKTEVMVFGVAGRDILKFMLHCTDTDYQKWWPGTHFAFHTKKRTPNNIGNQVYFDELVGERRLKFDGIVTTVISGKRIVWQLKKILKLPAWLTLDMEDVPGGVRILHTLAVGYQGIGWLLDPLLRLFMTARFESQLSNHTRIEFPALAVILNKASVNKR
jgi:hypothetical protein